MKTMAILEHCACCGGLAGHALAGPQLANRGISRRAALAGLLAAPVLPSAPAWAQDLLDPTSLGGSKVGAPALPTPRARPANWRGPGYPRAMAASVTSALVTLVRAYGGIADQIGKLQQQAKDLTAKRDAAIRDKASKLEEYRQGLFCSGCGKTRSEILARGEQFPHSGQTIIRPTAEQIAAKERELQAIIDNLENQIRDAKAKEGQLSPDIDTIRAQIFEGMGLWRSAHGFERRLIRQESYFDDDDYYRQLVIIARQLGDARAQGAAAGTIFQLERGIADLEVWTAALEQLQDRRAKSQASERQALLANESTARRQADQVRTVANEVAGRITAFGYAGYLSIVTVPMGVNVDASLAGGEAMGDSFRMGKYDRAGFGEILPNVAQFLADVRAFTYNAPSVPNVNPEGELYAARNALSRLKPRLAVAIETRRREQAEAELKRQQEAELRRQQAELEQRQTPSPGGF